MKILCNMINSLQYLKINSLQYKDKRSTATFYLRNFVMR